MARQRATLTFSQRDEGTVQVEIRTPSPLGSVVSNAGERFAPAEYLTWESAFSFMCLAPHGQPWRYIEVFAQAPGRTLVKRYLDLSEGSHERAMVEALVGQRKVPVMWVNEGVQAIHQQPSQVLAHWLVVIESTRGISAGAWREEMDEVAWRNSESSRPGQPRPRRHRRRTAEPPPAVTLPFFARRSGSIPRDGTPELGRWCFSGRPGFAVRLSSHA